MPWLRAALQVLLTNSLETCCPADLYGGHSPLNVDAGGPGPAKCSAKPYRRLRARSGKVAIARTIEVRPWHGKATRRRSPEAREPTGDQGRGRPPGRRVRA